MVLVDDEVAGAQVGEGLQRATQPLIDTGRALAEDLRVREQDEPELAPDEPATGGGDREQELRLRGQVRVRVDDPGLDPAQQVLGPQGLAPVRERDHHALPGPQERAELGLGLGEPPCGDRRSLRLEGERLAGRERVELRRAFQVEGRAELFGADRAHLVGLPDQVGRALERRHEVAGNRRQLTVVAVPRLDQIEPSLGGRVDRGAVHGPQRALREGREDPDRLHLVTEQLDPERLAAGAREDIDDPAADGELAALLGPVDPLVAGKREQLGQLVALEEVADGDRERLGPGRRRREALRERRRGGTDEAAACEHVQRARPLPDEVRRRLEP